jgi:hypothetical protein
MSWERRLAPIAIGAVVVGVIAAVAGALTHPYEEIANEARQQGQQIGLVVRYAFLGAAAGGLLDALVRESRRHGSLWAAIADRSAALLESLALVGVVLIAVIPLFAGGYGAEEYARDERAGFIDGCTKNAPLEFCLCLYEEFATDPAADSRAERDAIMRRIQRTRQPPPVMRRAAAACARVHSP